ncbi:MAG: 5-(carboxyamino)imidazole ribonucleotide synthase [Actinobacteria bacterium]|nr:5-(carboxyamino)imidazole ribonucleotide synthase [Actinomycetota bacterium]
MTSSGAHAHEQSTQSTRVPLVAVLGGGQLGRMLALAGIPLGVRFRFLDPSPDAPARDVGDLVVAPLDDPGALDDVSAGADVVTYEWEGVPGAAARRLGSQVAVYPPADALTVSQDRLREKQLFSRLGIPVPRFLAVDDRGSLERAVAEVGLPAVLKTRVGGYDGKGQVVLRELGDLAGAWESLGVPSIVESFVPFTRELSVLGVRGADGETRTWPLVENRHERGILRRSLAPAPDVEAGFAERACSYMTTLLDELDYRGVLALEMFECGGGLLANEIAPRVHNSGHWTIEGAETSQFENHVRAVLGWPLGLTEASGVSVMVNCIGTLPEPDRVLRVDGAHLHRYGKSLRRGRKVGHVTVVAADRETLEQRLARLDTVMPGDDG